MIAAVFSDIHSNLQAFDVCLDYAFSHKAEHFIFLGDYVSGCAYPDRTMDRIYQVQKEIPCTFIRGNREEYMLDYRDGKKEKWEYGSGTGNLLYTYENLRPTDFAFFETMTDRKAVKIEGLPELYLCHGTPEASRGSLAEHHEETLGLLSKINETLVLCGHTHHQYTYERWGKRVINPGAVGLSFDDEGHKAQMAMLYGKGGVLEEAELVRLDYDWKQTLRDFEESGLREKANVWAAMDMHVIRTGDHKTYQLPFLVHQLFLDQGGSDVPWREVPESFWEKAAKMKGIL